MKGGCFCGEIRYEIQDDDDILVLNCHCSMCRRTNGAPYVTWAIVPNEKFQITQGELTFMNSSEAGTRGFCNKCGTHMTCVNTKHPDIIDITIGSLDDQGKLSPTLEVFTDSKLGWVNDLSGLKAWQE